MPRSHANLDPFHEEALAAPQSRIGKLGCQATQFVEVGLSIAGKAGHVARIAGRMLRHLATQNPNPDFNSQETDNGWHVLEVAQSSPEPGQLFTTAKE